MAFSADLTVAVDIGVSSGVENMTKWFITFLWAVFSIAGANGAVAQDHWARINSAVASANAKQVIVDTSGWTDGCKGIRIAVDDGTIAIEQISIVYATGRVHSENPVTTAPCSRPARRAVSSHRPAIPAPSASSPFVSRASIGRRAPQPSKCGVCNPVPRPAIARHSRASSSSRRRSLRNARRRTRTTPPRVTERSAQRPAARSEQPQPPPPTIQSQPPPPAAGGAARKSVDASREAERSIEPRTRTRSLTTPGTAPSTAPPADAPVITSQPSEPSGGSGAAPQPDKPYTEVDVFFGTDRKREADRVEVRPSRRGVRHWAVQSAHARQGRRDRAQGGT